MLKPIIKLLFIATFPPPEGGQRIIYDQLWKDINNKYTHEIYINKIDLSGKKYGFLSNLMVFGSFFKVIVKIPFFDVITLQAPFNYIHTLGPFIYLICKLFHKPIILRRSAGNNITVFEKSSNLWKTVLKRTILNSSLSLYETDCQVQYFSSLSRNSIQLMGNNRVLHEIPWKKLHHKPVRFVFIGLVSPEKGINEIINAFKQLSSDLTIDIYGSDIMDIELKINNIENINYKGEFSNHNIYNILSNYEVLVIPTYWKGEGQPGVIIEAFMMNIPIIATKHGGINELITSRYNGLLVGEKNVDELKEAILKIHNDFELYNTMSNNIYKEKYKYSTAYWTDFFVEKIKELTN